MAFDDLTQFLQAASDAGELMHIATPTDPALEIAAATDLLCREFQDRSPALLFEQVSGKQGSVVTNLLGSRQRFLKALGVDRLDEALGRIHAGMTNFQPSREWGFSAAMSGTDRTRCAPRTIRRGHCQQVIQLGHDIDLLELPTPTCWPGESGPAFTSAMAIFKDFNDRVFLEAVLAEVVDRTTLLLHWSPTQQGQRVLQAHRRRNRQMPVAIALGGDPLLSYVSSLPLPDGVPVWLFAGLLRNEGVNLIRARTMELDVPADAEYILEGLIDPSLPFADGVLANRHGVLEQRNDLPALQVTAVTHRANPILPCTIFAPRFQEDFVCSELTELFALALIRSMYPCVMDLHLPRSGGHRRTVTVRVDDDDPQMIRKIASALGGLPLTSDASLTVITGPDVNLRDDQSLWQAVSLSLGVRHVAGTSAEEGRLVIDAASRVTGNARRLVAATPDVQARVLKQFENLSEDPAWNAVLAHSANRRETTAPTVILKDSPE